MKAINFCMVILYPATFNVWVSFIIDFLDFPRYTIKVMKYRKTFYFVAILILIFFSCLIALANISRKIMNSNRDSGHPCLVPDLSRNASSISPLNKTMALVLRYKKFIMLRKYPTVSIFLRV